MSTFDDAAYNSAIDLMRTTNDISPLPSVPGTDPFAHLERRLRSVSQHMMTLSEEIVYGHLRFRETYVQSFMSHGLLIQSWLRRLRERADPAWCAWRRDTWAGGLWRRRRVSDDIDEYCGSIEVGLEGIESMMARSDAVPCRRDGPRLTVVIPYERILLVGPLQVNALLGQGSHARALVQHLVDKEPLATVVWAEKRALLEDWMVVRREDGPPLPEGFEMLSLVQQFAYMEDQEARQADSSSSSSSESPGL